MWKTIKKIGMAAVMYAALACGTAKAEEAKIFDFDLGPHFVEASVNTDGNLENRLILNDDIIIGDTVDMGYHGLNIVNDLDMDTYFGNHKFTLGLQALGGHAKLNYNVKTDKEGVIAQRFGVRNYTIPGMLGGYGFIDLLGNKDGIGLDIFYGKPLGKGFTLEIANLMNKPFDGAITNYTELALKKQICKDVDGFLRLRTVDFAKPEDGTYELGICAKF